MGERPLLRLVEGGLTDLAPEAGRAPDVWVFQADCVQAFANTWVVRGFAPTTISAYSSLLPRVLAHFDRPVWLIEPAEVDAMLHSLLLTGRTASTRRRYLDMLRAFHAFVRLRYTTEIRALYGTTVTDPLDRFNRLRHVWDEPARHLPPAGERLAAFFAFARTRLTITSDYPAAARDYALWRTLYHSAPRLSEALRLELCDVHPELGPFGKLHVRFGKAANASGPRPRWAPMLDGLDQILAWYQSDIRPLFPDTAALFCDPQGQPLKPETVRDRLSRLLDTEPRPEGDRFTPTRPAPRLRNPPLRTGHGPAHRPAAPRTPSHRLNHGLRPSQPHLRRGRLAPRHPHRPGQLTPEPA
ncbi:integrase/recombinase XerD [Streptomyces sp. V4I8]